MNDNIARHIKILDDQIAGCQRARQFLESHFSKQIEQLSEDVQFSACSDFLWFRVTNRDDLQILMSAFPKWTKTPSGSSIDYSAESWHTCDDFVIRVVISAGDKAIPPTCHLVKKQVLVPARGEHYEEQTVIICDDSLDATSTSQ